MESYFKRFGFCGQQIAASPSRELGLVVVIPCFNEPDLPGCLESLWMCERPACATEVIVVLNSATHCEPTVRLTNQQAFAAGSAWAASHADARLAFHLLHCPDLPAKQAGVGLARKIGMDEAVRRLHAVGRPEGIMAGYDADCRCDANYLISIERHFRAHPRSPGCSVYFEHPLEGPLGPGVYEAIAAYELHLRYYVQGLRLAGFPYAHHTIGSCMAVRAEEYVKQGGMNKRQAGEDFYFLQKIISLGGFTDLTETRVIPSPRASDRVPFGTGQAVRDCLNGEQIGTYALETFLDLKKFFDCVPSFYDLRSASGSEPLGLLPPKVRDFLQAQDFASVLSELWANTSNAAAFQKRFFHWFNAFQAMKFAHHARDHFYGPREVAMEAGKLLAHLPGVAPPLSSLSRRQLLGIYRTLDRQEARGTNLSHDRPAR